MHHERHDDHTARASLRLHEGWSAGHYRPIAARLTALCADQTIQLRRAGLKRGATRRHWSTTLSVCPTIAPWRFASLARLSAKHVLWHSRGF
jgi:hypothetical protein